jgi:phage gp36-like protein
MTSPKNFELLPSTMVSANSATGAIPLEPDRDFAQVTVEVSLLAADSKVDVYIETGPGTVGWQVVTALTGLASADTLQVNVVGCKARLRARYEVIGSVQLAIRGVTHQSYCTNKDIDTFSLPHAALAGMPADLKALACLAATDEAVSYLGSWFDLPLTAWSMALRMHVSNMAAYHAMKRRGFNPDADESIRLGYTDAIKWLQGPAKYDPEIEDTTPKESAETAYMISQPPRGWQLLR